MKAEYAETLALRALGWLAADDELFQSFLTASGLTVTELRERASEPGVLVSVLDFLLMSDDWVLGFAAEAGVAPQEPMTARQILAGPELHWT